MQTPIRKGLMDETLMLGLPRRYLALEISFLGALLINSGFTNLWVWVVVVVYMLIGHAWLKRYILTDKQRLETHVVSAFEPRKRSGLPGLRAGTKPKPFINNRT